MRRYPRTGGTSRRKQPDKSMAYGRKLLKQLIFCAILAALLVLGRGIPVSGGRAGDYAQMVLSHTTDLKKAADDITAYVKQQGLLPEWALRRLTGEQPQLEATPSSTAVPTAAPSGNP